MLLLDREPREHRVLLEHEAQRVIDAADRRAVVQHLAFGRRQQARHHAQQRGLAAARFADDADELAARDVEVDVAQHGQRLRRRRRSRSGA